MSPNKKQNKKTSKEKIIKGNGVTRRDFLGTAAGIGALSVIPGHSKGETEKVKKADWYEMWKKREIPFTKNSPTSKPNGLNIIIIMTDTWRTDHLGCYGSMRVKTPYIDKFAKESVVFTDAYAEGLATIPCRRVMRTGKSYRADTRWRPLSISDITLPEVLGEYNYTSAFIADTPHYFKPGYNYHVGFDSWEWIRGNENDKWESGPKEKIDTKKHVLPHWWDEKYHDLLMQYLLNTLYIKDENDYFCARTFSAGLKWLEKNRNSRPFMLWVETFDPHEPWDAPPRFQKMYRDKYPCERTIFGYGINKKKIRDDDIPVIKDLYAAEVTFTDYAIGRFLKSIKEMGLMENTIVIFTTDHGTHLGEEGCVQKTSALLNRCYAHIPLIIRHPDTSFGGKRIDAPVSAIDFMPTCLAMLGINNYKDVDGDNMWKLATGKADSIHDDVFTVAGRFAAAHNSDWHYFQNFRGSKQGHGPCLYDLKKDPMQTKNVIKEFPDVAHKLRDKMQKYLRTEIPPLKIK